MTQTTKGSTDHDAAASPKTGRYFPYHIQIRELLWNTLQLDAVRAVLISQQNIPEIFFFRQLANRMNRLPERAGRPVSAGLLYTYAVLVKIFRYITRQYATADNPGIIHSTLDSEGLHLTATEVVGTLVRFAELFPGADILDKKSTPRLYLEEHDKDHARKEDLVLELLLLWLAGSNPAIGEFRELLDERELESTSSYRKLTRILLKQLDDAPPVKGFNVGLITLLLAPIKASPHSLAGQLAFIRKRWAHALPDAMMEEITRTMDILQEEERQWWGPKGPPPVLDFSHILAAGSYDYPEYELYSSDSDWMSNIVLIAKMAYVWLYQLSRIYHRPLTRLDQIPDEELDRIARWGFNCLWLIGIWERSPASKRIKHICGNIDAAASAYSLYDYCIAGDLGGEEALNNLKDRAARRGIRLACDMVPNHTGIYSRWMLEHPDWYIQQNYPPFPAYSFNGENLSQSPDISLFIEDGYFRKSDAAVVFKYTDNRSGNVRYIYHGNDGTSTPWNDTAQLNYLLPEVRETVINTILNIARKFKVIRFDAAMTLAKKHYQRLWFPLPGHGGSIPSRAEHSMTRKEFDAAFPNEFWREVVDRVAAEVPDTLLIAEAFWLMEGYFVRTLGMHRVYNSAFMNMLKTEDNAKYRQTIKNILEFDPRILKRFVNFMNNPDEDTAIAQFGREGKYIGAALMLVTMPGLPMFGHGQIEGFHEKYGMEYTRAYRDEQPDQYLIAMHEAKIFPLMRRRSLFSGSEHFLLYDFFTDGRVNEDVFAYSNRHGDDRALIVYHNKFAETSGWVRISSAIAVKSGQGETRLVQRSLGEGLAIDPGERHFYIFRDYATGLEYIRRGKELSENGLFVSLKAFEYHAFLDFRDIYDDDHHTWKTVCERLDGRPAVSIHEEYKQVRFAPVIDLFTVCVAEMSSLLRASLSAEGGKKKKQKKTAAGSTSATLPSVSRFSGSFAQCTGMEGMPDIACAAVEKEFSTILFLLTSSPRKVDVKKTLSGINSYFSDAHALHFGSMVIAIYILLHRLGLMTQGLDEPVRSTGAVEDCGLARSIKATFRQAVETGQILPLHGDTGAKILQIMILHQQAFGVTQEHTLHSLIHDLFMSSMVQEFLQYNVHEGVEWFNKERFEELVYWLTWAALIEEAASARKKTDINTAMVRLSMLAGHLKETAAVSGYRVRIFLEKIKTVAQYTQ